MHILNKENLVDHCRTCLKYGNSTFVEVRSDGRMVEFIEQYIDGMPLNDFDDYSIIICPECSQKMKAVVDFIHFAKKAMYITSGIVDDEMDCWEIESVGLGEQKAQLQTSENDILLKSETLVKTESLLLDGTSAIGGVIKLEPESIATVAVKGEIDPPENEANAVSSPRSACTSEHTNNGEHNSVNNSVTQDELDPIQILHKPKGKERPAKTIVTKKRQQPARGVQEPTTTKKRQYRCAECGQTFGVKISLDAHERKEHQGIGRPFQCEHCDKAYARRNALAEHIKVMHEQDASTIICSYPGCEKVYTSFSGYNKHKNQKHLGEGLEKNHVCEQCGLRFSQLGNLKSHRRNRHPTDAELAKPKKPKDNLECKICKKVMHQRYAFDCHMLQHHSEDLRYECDECGKKMAKKFMLVQHKVVHASPNMPCEHCGKQFKRKFDLEGHIRSVHSKLKPFKCEVCGMDFAMKSRLLNHKHIHDSEEKKIPCKECEKLFRFKYDLGKHVRLVHRRIKPHICTFCGQAFGSGGSLRHHVYIHTGEKPYECDTCGKCFRQPTALKTHRNIHLKQPGAAVV